MSEEKIKITLYEFRKIWFPKGRSYTIYVKGSLELVAKLISKKEMDRLFEGYALWKAPEVPTKEMPGKAIGVWSTRKISRFKRILKERGAELTIVKGEGPEQFMSLQSYFHSE
jgi:hypothetical protein